jgi:hypothetical protein
MVCADITHSVRLGLRSKVKGVLWRAEARVEGRGPSYFRPRAAPDTAQMKRRQVIGRTLDGAGSWEAS